MTFCQQGAGRKRLQNAWNVPHFNELLQKENVMKGTNEVDLPHESRDPQHFKWEHKFVQFYKGENLLIACDYFHEHEGEKGTIMF